MNDLLPVSITASDLSIPGIYLVHDFITAKEEEVSTWQYLPSHIKTQVLLSIFIISFNLLFLIVFHLYSKIIYKYGPFHLLRNCSKLLTADPGTVFQKEGFNTMVMSFVMM